ncbi:hypothetical protein B0H19DRAFT_300627 [Mycena capillaripes]|nr:hypothetical protein B0H19DRAFT_300627 [Mycena capillaripes]
MPSADQQTKVGRRNPLKSWCASARARVYTFRALLCWNIVTICVLISTDNINLTQLILCFLTIVHHLSVPFVRNRKFFAFDLCFLITEIVLS